jgi:hypothetical protein
VTRAEWLDFCRQRALTYLETGDIFHTAASFVSDLGKNAETKATVAQLEVLAECAAAGDAPKLRRLIEEWP